MCVCFAQIATSMPVKDLIRVTCGNLHQTHGSVDHSVMLCKGEHVQPELDKNDYILNWHFHLLYTEHLDHKLKLFLLMVVWCILIWQMSKMSHHIDASSIIFYRQAFWFTDGGSQAVLLFTVLLSLLETGVHHWLSMSDFSLFGKLPRGCVIALISSETWLTVLATSVLH